MDKNFGIILVRKTGNVTGGFGADVDYDYLTSHPIPVLLENICVGCLKKAFDVLEVELEKIR